MTSLAPEMARRQSNTDKVLALFRSSPRRWIYWTEFSELVGERAYRTRISNAKSVIVKEGGVVQSISTKRGRQILTYYRYLPYVPLGPSAETPRERRLF